MHHAESNKFRLFKARNHLQNTFLLPPFEIGLKAHKVPQPAVLVFLTELHHRIGTFGPANIPVIHITPTRIPKANWLEGSITHRVFTAPGQFFDGQTSFEECGIRLIEVFELCLFCLQQGIAESQVLLTIHWAVDVVRVAFVVATRSKSLGHIDAVTFNDRARGIEEMTVSPSGEAAQILSESITREWARRENGDLVRSRKRNLLFALKRDPGMLVQQLGQRCAVTATVNGKSPSRGNGMTIGHLNHDRPQTPQFFLEKSRRPVTTEGSKAVAAHKLRTFRAVMSGRATNGPHLHQLNIDAGFSHLPRCFRASESSTDHHNGWSCQMDQGRWISTLSIKRSIPIRPDCA